MDLAKDKGYYFAIDIENNNSVLPNNTTGNIFIILN